MKILNEVNPDYSFGKTKKNLTKKQIGFLRGLVFLFMINATIILLSIVILILIFRKL